MRRGQGEFLHMDRQGNLYKHIATVIYNSETKTSTIKKHVVF